MAVSAKWIKLMTDMFDNAKIKYIRTLPEGNNIVLIWVMLLAKAGKCNCNGYIFLVENIPYTPEMLSAEFGFDINIIKLALGTLAKLNMIQLENLEVMITGWNEHQNTEGLDKIREQTRKRVAKCREKQKELTSGYSSVTCNATVTESNATEEEEEEDIEEDKDIYIDIISYLNSNANTKYRNSTSKTRSLIKNRIKEGFKLDDFKTVINNKCNDWLNTDMEKYLRPETLFGSKFESYLNQKVGVNDGNNRNGSFGQNYGQSKKQGKFTGFKPAEYKCELTDEERRRAEEELI